VQARQPRDVCYSSELSLVGKCSNPIENHDFACEWLRTGSMVWKDDSMELFRFWQMCDGRATYTNAEDERHCDVWKGTCNRLGDRCNGHWDCLDGSDEVNCKDNNSPKCNDGYRYCFTFRKLTCISVSKIGDGIIDCLGATDERNGYCLYKHPKEPTRRFHCANSSRCVKIEHICDGYAHCPKRDDELMCPWRQHLIGTPSCPQGMFACRGHSHCHIDGRDRCKKTASKSNLCQQGEDKWFCDLIDNSPVFSFVSMTSYSQFPPYEKFTAIDPDISNGKDLMHVKSSIITKNDDLFRTA
jgi:hypothetical protein